MPTSSFSLPAAHYRDVLHHLAQGYMLLDIEFGAQGEAVDILIREVNLAQRHIDGIYILPGQRVRELRPAVEEQWIQRYAQVARSGEPAQFEDWSQTTRRWYEVSAQRVGGAGSTLVAVIYADITARRHTAHQQQVLVILESQEEERRRIAESLHNGIGQMLYAIKLRLDQLPLPLEEPVRVEVKLLLEEAMRQTRVVSHELTPAILAEFGLQKALETTCLQLNSPALRWHCYVDLEEAILPVVLQQAVYRLVQGLAHNVAKHAQASEASVEVAILPSGWMTVYVEDNGQGFDLVAVREGLGLKTLHSRVALLGGTVRLDTAPGQGTRIEVRLPVS